MTSSPLSQRVRELKNELLKLAQRGHNRAFETVGTNGPLDLPTFYDVVRVARHTDDVASADIEAVLEAGIEGMRHEPLHRVLRTTVARKLYFPDLEAVELHMSSQGTKYESAVLASIDNVLGVSNVTRKRYLSATREMLARSLLRMAYPSLFPSLPDDGVAEDRPGLVSRPKLQADLQTAMSAVTTPTFLWGESGNGKSVLARQVVDQRNAHEDTVWLRQGHDEGSDFDLDMTAELHRRRIGTARLVSFTSRINVLRELLDDPSTRGLFVFDNLHPRLADQLLYGDNQVQAKVLVTQRSEPPTGFGLSIQVDGYADLAEAVRAAKQVLPDVDEVQLEVLVEILGRRPIAIDLACRLIALDQITIDDANNWLELDPRGGLSDASELVDERYNEPIAQVYSLAANVLRREPDDRAIKVLDTLLWLQGRRSTEGVVDTCLGTRALPTELAVRSGLSKLRRLGLAQIYDTNIEINDLTVALLRQEFVDRLGGVLRDYFEVGLDALPDLPEPFGSLDPAVYSSRVGRAQHDRTEMFRLSQAIQVRRAMWVNRFAAAEFDAGTIYVGGDDFLMWQRGVEWFARADGQLQVALATATRAPGYLVWSPGSQPVRADELLSDQIRGFKYWQRAGLRVTRRMTGQDLTPGMTREEHLDIGARVADGVEHRWVSHVPADVAARHTMPLWTDCGHLIVPPRRRPNSYCGDCAGRDQDSDQRVRAPIAYMTTVVDGSSCEWSLGASLVNAYMSRSGTADWDAEVLSLAQEILARDNDGHVSNFAQQRFVYWLWYKLAALNFVDIHQMSATALFGEPPMALEVQRLTRRAIQVLDPLSACLFATQAADVFRRLGHTDYERSAVSDAFDAAAGHVETARFRPTLKARLRQLDS